MPVMGITRPADPVSTSTGTLGPPFTEMSTISWIVPLLVPLVLTWCRGTVAFTGVPAPAAPLLPYSQPPRPPAPPTAPAPPAPPAPPLPIRPAAPPVPPATPG